MDTLKNRQASRAAKSDNNGEQVPTKVTKDVKNGDNDKTKYVHNASTFHEQLLASAKVDVRVATDNVERERAEVLVSAIHAPGKADKQARTAESHAETASNSANAKGTAQSQANQTGTGNEMQSKNPGQKGNGGGWKTGQSAVDGNANGGGAPAKT